MFLWNSCFFEDPTDDGNLISGSSAFSKSKLEHPEVHSSRTLRPGLENFEYYFASVWDKYNCVVVWTFFGIAFLWDWNENWPFPVLRPLLSFPDLLHVEYSTLTAPSFRVWNSSTGIPSLPLVMFIVMLPKVHLTSLPTGREFYLSVKWNLASLLSFFFPPTPFSVFLLFRELWSYKTVCWRAEFREGRKWWKSQTFSKPVFWVLLFYWMTFLFFFFFF